MVRIELENGEEAISRTVTKFGRIEGLKKWVGSNVMLIRIEKQNTTSSGTKNKHGRNDGGGII